MPRTVGRGIRGKEREGGRERERKGREQRDPSLIVGVTFCVSGETSCQNGLKRASPSGSWMADGAARSPADRVNPHFETVLDFDAGCLGGRVSIPFPSSSTSFPARLLFPAPCTVRKITELWVLVGEENWVSLLAKVGPRRQVLSLRSDGGGGGCMGWVQGGVT